MVKTVEQARNILGMQLGWSLGAQPTYTLLRILPDYYKVSAVYNVTLGSLTSDDLKYISDALTRVQQ